jgi:hypothetical protein
MLIIGLRINCSQEVFMVKEEEMIHLFKAHQAQINLLLSQAHLAQNPQL